ncbi:Mannan endo-1,4-beta-mannosidase A and B precursor [Roseovarius gaetbuli]|uniref:Mannan endo-1,4-beta-mannosidase A and B n=1 Tax=Roseovarius gaetbuli TaxID=1356575 RepID=A0A1X6Z0L8_9RHOB|nr:hypothetical protein [Roseovarius gaetbuli]SLN36728.1 Mannan endo-1,4-beta-mannosidase A and B precursor [Roseovarius gaetbuli]
MDQDHDESLLWHLKVPRGYTSKVAPDKLVFPGDSMINTPTPPATHTAVDLEGYVDCWITDMECATSLRPKLYGFDYGRVADIVEASLGMVDGVERFEKRLITTIPQTQRAGTPSIPSEKAMMKDLMLSAYAKGGKVCLSYHMLNPFLTPADNSGGADPLRYHASLDETHLDSAQFQTEFAAQSGTVDRGSREMGRFLDDLLGHAMADGKDIYVRLLHEPKIDYFWWGEADGHNANAYMANFISLWNAMVAAILDEIDEDRRARVKFVFCMNGKPTTGEFEDDLDRYFPTGAASAALSAFLNSIAVLGLDYYEEPGKDPTASHLADQYDRLVAKVAAVNAAFGLEWGHALTEVGIRTAFKGKLYGEYNSGLSILTNEEKEWPADKRTFFNDVVFALAKRASSKWVMFWVNRLGNSAFSALTPSTAIGATLRYGETDVFTHAEGQFFYPMLPSEPFSIETYQQGFVDAAGVQQKTFVKIAATDPALLDQIPGALQDGRRTSQAKAYQDAVTDFFRLVPTYIKTLNASGVLAVEAYQRGTLSRPFFSQSPVPPDPNAPDIIFDTL